MARDSLPRERILECFAESPGAALPASALARRLGKGRAKGAGRGAKDTRALRRALDALVREGRLERFGRRYRLPRRDALIQASWRGEGRAVDEGGRSWRATARDAVAPGDSVLLEVLDRGGAVAEIVDVRPERSHWLGILERRRSGGVVTPYRDDARWSVEIAPADCGEARSGDVVLVEPITSRSRRPDRQARSKRHASKSRDRGRRGRSTAPEPIARGRVVERIGRPGEPEADFRAVVWRRRLRVVFPEAAEAEAEALPDVPEAAERRRRVDLRERPFLTIDPATARDHDDAVCVEALPGGATRLWVAIADVAHWVPRGSELDREAERRGNSVYFPDRAIPMLPERLSGGLCSLRPEEDRLAMVVELVVDKRGAVTRRSFYPARIRSRARLSYEEAAGTMQSESTGSTASTGEGVAPVHDPELLAQLRGLDSLAQRLGRRRREHGSIDFDLPSAEIVLGDAGHPVDIVDAPRSCAHQAIEEAMLVANREVARFLREAEVPAVYRVHAPPRENDLEALAELLGSLGLLRGKGSGSARLSSLEIAAALERALGRPQERLVHWTALRTMQQARYSPDCTGHYALGFEHYLHFTSPIRRYADLIVHRQLKRLLESSGQASENKRKDGRMARLSARLSFRERAAMEAEREMVDLKKCAFMADRVGELYDGEIASVARHGFYVRLDDFAVDGLVPIASLAGRFELDERSHALVARRAGRRHVLGDRVRVRVEAVDRIRAWITFALLETQSGASRRASSSSARRSQSR